VPVSQDHSTAGDDEPIEHWVQGVASGFLWVEHATYAALGVLLSLTALLALAATAALMWSSLPNWNGEETILHVIDRLLFVLMLVEILHTVRASMRTGGLTCEPFLVVGLIASIRRVLVITLRSSQTTKENEMSDAAERLFRASMEELVVLAVLITVMVIAIYILHRTRSDAAN
jgi:uncharacterized membrane protein (DUF373 family)